MDEKFKKAVASFRRFFTGHTAKKTKKRNNIMDNQTKDPEDLKGLFVDTDSSDTVSDDADDLIKHIDDFKKKAAELKMLMANHRNKAHELERMVANKADESERLDNEIENKKRESAAFGEAIKTHIGNFGEDIKSAMNANLDKVNNEVKKSLDDFESRIAEEINSKISADLESIAEGQKTNKEDIADKIHFESVQCYNNIKATIDETNSEFSRVISRLEAAEDASRSAGKIATAGLVFSIICTLGVAGMVVLTLMNMGFIVF